MLVLSRKKDEKIIIRDHITIMVIEIRGDKVRLGIDAPKEVSVHRQEVYEAIQRENASKSNLENKTDDNSSSSGNSGLFDNPSYSLRNYEITSPLDYRDNILRGGFKGLTKYIRSELQQYGRLWNEWRKRI